MKDVNEDRITLVDTLGGSSAFGSLGTFAAVYDGHGGTWCADFLKRELHGYFRDSYQKRLANSQITRSQVSSSDSGITILNNFSDSGITIIYLLFLGEVISCACDYCSM